MRKKPTIPQSVVELTAEYAKARDDVNSLIVSSENMPRGEFVESARLCLKRIESKLETANKKFVATFVNPKTRAADTPIIKAFRAELKSMRRGTYIELQNGVKTATGRIRATINEAFSTLNKSDAHMKSYADAIKAAFAEKDILTVEYQNGSKIKLDNYAAMLARTSRIETDNVNSFMNAIEDGTDLVQCIGQSPTCGLCAIYRNRVFSISGKSKDYPPLYGGEISPLREGYHAIHPNCRCQFLPYFTELESPEKVERDKARSNEPFVDNRIKKERDSYAAWQATNRKLWNEQAEYEKMRTAYGSDMPYKTLGSFRKAYRSDQGSTAYDITHRLGEDVRQYEAYAVVLGKDNMPDTLAKFREMKYNSDSRERRRFDLLRQFKESVANDMVTNVGFAEYERITAEAHDRIIGITTSDGRKVEAISQHLVDRIIGCDKVNRKGITIGAVIHTLVNGTCNNIIKIDGDGLRSVGFIKDGSFVSLNIDTNKVVQCRCANKKERKQYG